MLTNIRIERFRGIQKTAVTNLADINVFVGKNNSGKTTLAEAVFLLIGASNAELPIKVNAFRQFPLIDPNTWFTFFNNCDVKDPIIIAGDFNNPDESRTLKIRPLNRVQFEEKSFIRVDKYESSRGFSDGFYSFDGLLLSLEHHVSGKTKGKCESKILLRGPKLEIKLPKEYQEKRRGRFISSPTNVNSIPDTFNEVQINKLKGRVLKTLQELDPKIQDVALGSDKVVLADIGANKMIPLQMVGDGVVRFLGILLALYSVGGGILIVDEIDNGLHYSAQKTLWETVLKGAQEFNVQVFATTHSIECIRGLVEAKESLPENNQQFSVFRIEDQHGICAYDPLEVGNAIKNNFEVR